MSNSAVDTFEAITKTGEMVTISLETRRLFWSLQGPLSSSIFVMGGINDPDAPRESYFRQTPTGTSWHPIAQAAVTDPQVSSITVNIGPLDLREEEWLLGHDQSTNLGDVDRAFRKLKKGVNEGKERSKTAGPQLTVMASGEKPYVTIHDYVTAVHGWLIGLREEIWDAMQASGDKSLTAEAKLMVNYNTPDHLLIDEEECWCSLTRSSRCSRHLEAVFGTVGAATPNPSPAQHAFNLPLFGPGPGEEIDDGFGKGFPDEEIHPIHPIHPTPSSS